MTETKPVRHPAKFSDPILDEIRVILDGLLAKGLIERGPLLDPFAGTGKVHSLADLGFETFGVELEPEWATQHPRTIVGDATALDFVDDFFEVVVTSPCYGNRMADKHNAKDLAKCPTCRGAGKVPTEFSQTLLECSGCGGTGRLDKLSTRNTYKHALGRDLTPGSAAGMQWGKAYRDLHERAWREAIRVTRPSGFLIVNVKNHYRTKEKGGPEIEQQVVEFHMNTLLVLGCFLYEARRVATSGNQFGENYDVRVPEESILIVRTPPPGPPRLF